jgi:hypothetical protein
MANPGTIPDPNWIGRLVTPNHLEYPAAHGCFKPQNDAMEGIQLARYSTPQSPQMK